MEDLEKLDPRLFEMLEGLFLKESFKKDILKYRKKIGIPDKGFKSNEIYVNWIKGKINEFFDIQCAGVKMATAFKFPIHIAVWVEAYLILGNEYKKFDETTMPIENMRDSHSRGFEGKSDLNCTLDPDSDYQCMNIKVYPGASERSINAFIKNNYDTIKKFLDKFDNEIKPTRKRRVTKRNSEIYECYEKGLLTRYGKKVENKDYLLPEGIQNMDMDMRRKIIEEEIKMRK